MAYSLEKDVYPFIGSDDDTDIILFFTDNKNEPRKINVRRCIEDDTDFSGNALGYVGDDLDDFITACPKTPDRAIHFAWNKNLEFESNFQETNGLQFAYQNVYIDGFVTAISPMSEVAFPPAIQNLGSSSLSSVTVESECILEIPSQGREIATVRILFREGNDGVFKLIDEVSNQKDVLNPLFDYEGSDILGYYTFRNDSVYPVVPSSQTSKNFDNLPRKAKAQSVSGNRLMYGNYVEGYDPIRVSAEAEVLLSDVDQATTSVDTQIQMINVFTDKRRAGGARGESIGFTIDVGEDAISDGLYKLSIDIAPEMNYHLFDSFRYTPSKNQTFNGNSDFTFEGVSTGADPGLADGIWNIETPSSPAVPEATNGTKMLYGYDAGRSGISALNFANDNGGVSNNVGTTAANPVIIPRKPIKLEMVLSVSYGGELPPYAFMSAIKNAIDTGDSGSQYVSVVSYTGVDYEINNPWGWTINDLNRSPGLRTVVESRSGLQSGSSFEANSSLADAVCWVPYSSGGEDIPNAIDGSPAVFYYVNEADMLLNVRSVLDVGSGSSPIYANGDNPQSQTKTYFRIEPISIKNVDIMTCLPEPSDGLGYVETDGVGLQETVVSTSRLPFQLPVEPSGINGQVNYRWPFVLGSATQSGGEAVYAGRTVNATVTENEAFGLLNGKVFLTATPVPIETGVPYIFRNESGSKKFKINISSFGSQGGEPFLVVDNNTLEHINGTGGTLVRWYMQKDVSQQSQADTVNPIFPRGAGIKDRDGNYLNFDRTAVAGRICPIAIARWYVFDVNDMASGNWKQSFKYEWTTVDGDPVSVLPVSTDQWFGPMSETWASYFAMDDIPLLESSQEPGGSYISFIDGRAGVGGLTDSGENGYSKISLNEVYIPYAEGDSISSFDGTLLPANSGVARPVSNRRGTVWNTTLIGIHENFKYIASDAPNADAGAYLSPSAPTDAEINSAPLEDLGSFLDIGIEGSVISSFKTKDFHDFGIVYFDKRGRAGTVNALPSVYVPGYSSSERASDEKGAAVVKYTINHLPPSWADSYKIVYAGSSNTERFIQYVAGGAFVEPNIIGGNNDKIYVSLNYLQGNRASYAKSYGAVDQDTGEPTLYRFTPGDKLRIISYYTDDTTIAYAPRNYEFDVIGVEEISLQQGTDSPLMEDSDNIDFSENFSKFGSFVVLRNNLQASGFTASDVSGGELNHNWGNRCIFEIVTPRKSRGDELKPYYETPYGGKIILENGVRVHQYGVINIDQGDVNFRQVPLNFRAYDSENALFSDIISASGESVYDETSQSRFRPYYLESSSLTDLFRSNARSYGKVHFAIDGYRERINDTSITYSDPTNQESFNVFYTSFNPLARNYFDMPAKYGDIDYLADSGDTLYVAQNSKIGKLGVDKSLTTTADGTDTLNLSREVLNSPRFFLEDVGTDGHPESVTWDNSTLYFVDMSRGVVVSAGEQGMSFISSAGMDKFFKKLFRQYPSDSRITTGYNPFTEELVVSIMKSGGANQLSSLDENSIDTILKQNTFAYDLSAKAWTTTYSFYSSNYASIGNSLISFKDVLNRGGAKDSVWVHDRGVKNTFYSRLYPSLFKSVSVENANLTKDYKSISIDGNTPWDLSMKTKNEDAQVKSFREYEGTFYSDIPRSENSSSKNNHKAVGLIKSVTLAEGNSFDLTFDTDITQYHITLSGTIGYISYCKFFRPSAAGSQAIDFVTSSSNTVEACPSSIVGKNKLRVTLKGNISDDIKAEFIEFAAGKVLIVESNSRIFGDPLRDKFLEITAKATPRGKENTELYSINIDYIESNLNSSR